METLCNQSQYPTFMKQKCVHSPPASQASQTNLSSSLAFPYPPVPGEHVLKRSATGTGKQDFPVQWFKFIHPSPKPMMTETPVQIAVHVAHSPITSMNYQWTINLHDGYPLSKLCNQKGTFHPLFTLSVVTGLPCFTLVMLISAHQNPTAPWRQWGDSGSCSQ